MPTDTEGAINEMRILSDIKCKVCDFFARAVAKNGIITVGSVSAAAVLAADSVSWARVFWSLLLMFIVPVVGFCGIRRLVARRSNGVNALLLSVLTLYAALCGFFAVRWIIAGWLSMFIVLIFVVGGLFYNVWLMSFALKLEK